MLLILILKPKAILVLFVSFLQSFLQSEYIQAERIDKTNKSKIHQVKSDIESEKIKSPSYNSSQLKVL